MAKEKQLELSLNDFRDLVFLSNRAQVKALYKLLDNHKHRAQVKALYKLLDNHKHNCRIKAFALNDTDPNLAIERAHYRGQAYVCEKIKNDIKKAEKEFNKRSKKVR